MALDPYAACPCGSGKKFKWCCQPIHVQIDRAFRQDNEGQHETALRLMEEVVAEHPGNPEAWGRQAQLLHQNNRLEDAENALQKAFDINPNYAFGYLLRGTFRYQEGEIAGALLLFRKAAELYDNSAHSILAQVYTLISDCEMKLQRPVAAHAALRLALHFQPASESLRENYEALFGTKSLLPHAARRMYNFLPPSPAVTADRRETWNQAIAPADQMRLTDAVRAFTDLTQTDPADASTWYNLGLAQAWTGANPAALEALDRYVALEADEEKAAAAWTLVEILRCGSGMEAQADYRQYSIAYQIRNIESLINLLKTWDGSGRLIAVQSAQEEGTLQALILQEPAIISSTVQGQCLPLGAYLFILHDLLHLSNSDKEALDGIRREIQGKIGSALSEGHERVVPVAFHDVLTPALVFPVGVKDPQEADHLIQSHAKRYFEETWIHQPLKSLSGIAPKDAVESPGLRKKVRGVVQFLQDCAAGGALANYDFDQLRGKLGLDAPAVVGATADRSFDINNISPAELATLPVENLSNQQLEQAFQAAQKLDDQETAGKMARTLISRPSSTEQPDRYFLYTYLVQRALVAGDTDAALQFVDEGEKDDCEHNEGRRRNDYELRRGQIHAQRGDVDQAYDLFDRLLHRDPANLRYRGTATETMLSHHQGARALQFAEEGLTQARRQNDRDSEQYFMELISAAKKHGG